MCCKSYKREQPNAPRVGVGVIVLRQEVQDPSTAEVLMIKRGKPPDRGLWCVPGGGLELGETLAACAAREVQEETGIRIRNRGHGSMQPGAQPPLPFTAVDVMEKDASGQLLYHYAVIEMLAVAQDPNQQPVPADDVDAAEWMLVSSIQGMPDVVPRMYEVICKALHIDKSCQVETAK